MQCGSCECLTGLELTHIVFYKWSMLVQYVESFLKSLCHGLIHINIAHQDYSLLKPHRMTILLIIKQ